MASRRRRRAEPSPDRIRTPLSQPGEGVEVEGDSELAPVLRRALENEGTRDADALTHGFHSYPARMHPNIAATLVGELATEDDLVLDPFCGSGTVLVECRVRGRRAAGVDLSPLALRIAEVKCDRRPERARTRFLTRVGEVTERSEARVRGRIPVRAPLSREEARWYAPHVLKELGGLHEEIQAVRHARDRRALEMVLSAIVVKFSRQRADTTQEAEEAPKRIRKGLVTEFFGRKGYELVRRWEALDEAAPARSPAPSFIEGDARRLPELIDRSRAPRLVIGSPPYGGTYDYAAHHARRFAWLGLDTDELERGEIGARRRLRTSGGVRRWDAEMSDVLRTIEAVLAENGMVLLLVGDAQLGRQRIHADDQLRRIAPRQGLDVRAVASHSRPDWTGGSPRREHLVALSRA